MKKAEMEEMLKKMEGFSMTIRNDYYEDNGKTVEEKNKDLIDDIEAILFRLKDNKYVKWTKETEEVYKWICDMCIMALHGAGIAKCSYKTNRGRSAEYNIKELYEQMMSEDL